MSGWLWNLITSAAGTGSDRLAMGRSLQQIDEIDGLRHHAARTRCDSAQKRPGRRLR